MFFKPCGELDSLLITLLSLMSRQETDFFQEVSQYVPFSHFQTGSPCFFFSSFPPFCFMLLLIWSDAMQTNRMTTLDQPCKEHIGFVCASQGQQRLIILKWVNPWQCSSVLAIIRHGYTVNSGVTLRSRRQEAVYQGTSQEDNSGNGHRKKKRGGEGKDSLCQGIIWIKQRQSSAQMWR